MDRISLAYGSGGKQTAELVKKIFLKNLYSEELSKLEDSAIIKNKNLKVAFTTDSYVVDPIFFPGGDIGRLCVCGTVNDISVSGAKIEAISLGFIIEEGLDISVLLKIVNSIKKTAKEAGVRIVTGDTKVVEKGKADKIFIKPYFEEEIEFVECKYKSIKGVIESN
ncbi:MAG: AIR synthase related protein, partial [Elusimicrobiales bacterium]|nr:AIR synthase related protein [Elusimicrobiales bacterium]